MEIHLSIQRQKQEISSLVGQINQSIAPGTVKPSTAPCE